mmetsp:Transcript_26506/g.38004  ORF Transcript_26506/g.38004 Transcript_26506/m.38004 type:complete len:456 (-) Transcript_26506:983-2350(-)
MTASSFKKTEKKLKAPSTVAEVSKSADKAKQAKVDDNLVQHAVDALLKHLTKTKKEKESLLEDHERILLQFSLAKIPTRASHCKPILIEIPHPIYKVDNDTNNEEDSLDEAEICIIVKDKETKASIKAMIEKFPSHLSCIKKVIGLESLRRKYSQYQQRRELLQQYAFFLADDRILPMVGKLLGKHFFKAKKQPIPVRVTRKESFPFAVRKSVINTHLFLPTGTCAGIRVGHTGMSVKHLAQNCISAANNVVEHIKGKWSNVLSISVKSTQSVALPFYSKTPTELVQLFQYPSVNKKRNRDEEDEDNNGADDEVVIEQDAKKVRNLVSKDAAKEKKIKSPLLAALKKQRLSSKLEKEQETLKDGSINVHESLDNNATEKMMTSKPAKKTDSTSPEDAIFKEKTSSSSKSVLLLESKVSVNDKKKSSRKSAKPTKDIDAATSSKLKKRNTVPLQTR